MITVGSLENDRTINLYDGASLVATNISNYGLINLFSGSTLICSNSASSAYSPSLGAIYVNSGATLILTDGVFLYGTITNHGTVRLLGGDFYSVAVFNEPGGTTEVGPGAKFNYVAGSTVFYNYGDLLISAALSGQAISNYGTLHVNGNVFLSSSYFNSEGSTTEIIIGDNLLAVSYPLYSFVYSGAYFGDFPFVVADTITLGGELLVTMVNDTRPVLGLGQMFTVFASEQPLVGQFANLPPNSTVIGTTDGSESFSAVEVFDPVNDFNCLTLQPIIVGVLEVVPGGYRFNHATQTFDQQVTLKNAGGSILTGKIMLLLGSLSADVSLINRSGYLGYPVNEPFVSADLGPNGLKPRQSVAVQLQFSDPSRNSITYSPAVIALQIQPSSL